MNGGDVTEEAGEPVPESLWLATTSSTEYEPLPGDRRVDTAIVGGGIVGLTAAIRLKEAGHEVAVIETGRVVEGVTGHTTAKLTSQHGLRYDRLCSTFGREYARQYATANEAAIDAVERRVEEDGIECDFRRTEAYVYTESRSDGSDLLDETRAARRLGLPASYTETTPLPFDVEGAIRFDEQAEFHPRKYLLALAAAVDGDGSSVFETTRALDIDPGRQPRVTTDRGVVVADQVIVASHFPFFDRGGYFARVHPKRAYLLAVRISGEPPEGMFYSTATPPATIRGAPVDGERLLIVGGQGHEPGLDGPATSERYRRCEAFARERFEVESVEYRWSTHDLSPVDGVPFVGRLGPTTRNVYVGTGFDGWGMTGGIAAGTILADLIVNGSSPWADVFDPNRFTPAASAKALVEDNALVAARFLGDRIRTALAGSGTLPSPGEGTVVRQGGKPVAVSRGEDGELHAVSAVCPHMWCLVEWNDAERTWDCPCHGSRFDPDGTVRSGPALEDLTDRSG